MKNNLWTKITTRKRLTHKDILDYPDNPFTIDRVAWKLIGLNDAEKIYVETVTDLSCIPEAKTDLIWLINKKYNIRSDFPWHWRPRKSVAMNHIWEFPRVSSASGKVITWDCVRLIPNVPHTKLLTLDKVKKEYGASVSNSDFKIAFISYDERYADVNFKLLKHKAPLAIRIEEITGIINAHKEISKQVDSEMVWVVDADARLVDTFEFDYQPPESRRNNTIYIWQAKNPINGLIYGHGAVKLIPRSILETLHSDNIDMTTSSLANFIQVDEVSNIHQFNTDPLCTWRTAFRECAKLARGSNYFGNNNDENEERLNTWCTKGEEERFGKYCINGAIAGKEFGSNQDNDMLLINDYEWLKSEFIKEVNR
jgi:hypothetical protein